MTDNTCEALVIEVKGDSKPQLVKRRVPLPTPAPHQLVVRVTDVAQNPTDVQAFDTNVFGDGAILGCDFAGVVASLGKEVKDFVVGDNVAGLIWGGEIKGLGAYGECTLADQRICFKIPEKDCSATQAATVPLASATSWLALFSKDCLNIDRNSCPGESILIWGGSSSVGLYAIQIANLYGLNVVTTCSPHNFDLVRQHGAHHIIDYRDEAVVDKIKQAAPKLKYVFDTIGNQNSSTTASKAMTGDDRVLCTVRPGKANTENVTEGVKVEDVLVWTAFLKEHQYRDFHWPPHKEDHELASEFFAKLPGWIEEGKIKPNVPKVLHGLESVSQGFQDHRDGKISGCKYVYRLEN